MACRFIDGFDHYDTGQLGAKWPSGGTGPASPQYTISQGGGRESGGGALNVSGSGGYVPPYLTLAAESTWTFGFAVLPTNFNGNGLAFLFSGVTRQLWLSVGASGYLSVTVNAGTYNATTQPLSLNTWVYVECQVVISSSAGSVTARINGTTVISETSINTDAAGSGTANIFGLANNVLGGNGNVGVQGNYDDLYLFDGTGSANTTFPSAIPTVQALWPKAPGTNAQWTPSPYTSNFANVNDLTPDGDFTVNQSGTAGQIDSFLHDDLRPATGTVFAVQHCITARTSTGAAHSIADLEYTGATAYVGPTIALPTGYVCVTSPHDTDPATGAAWTIADLNADEFGYKLIS